MGKPKMVFMGEKPNFWIFRGLFCCKDYVTILLSIDYNNKIG